MARGGIRGFLHCLVFRFGYRSSRTVSFLYRTVLGLDMLVTSKCLCESTHAGRCELCPGNNTRRFSLLDALTLYKIRRPMQQPFMSDSPYESVPKYVWRALYTKCYASPCHPAACAFLRAFTLTVTKLTSTVPINRPRDSNMILTGIGFPPNTLWKR